MSLNEAQIGVSTCERAKLPMTNRLRVQTYIPNALNNLARSTVNDYEKRQLLVTDSTAVTSTITASGGTFYSDISTLLNTPGIMPDYLEYGTVFVTYPVTTFTTGNVNTTLDTVTITAHGYKTGLQIRLTTSNTLPAGLSLLTSYWLIVLDVNTIQFATTSADAFAGVFVDLTSVGIGTQTITQYGPLDVLQWVDVPAFANLDTGGTPIPFIYGWLQGSKIFLTGVNGGTLNFAVPFIPTLATLPSQLESDLIDQMIDLVINSGEELPEESAIK